MIPSAESLPRKSRLAALLDHLAEVEDPRDVRRISHRLDEILLLVVCGTIADCDDHEDIAAWGSAHLDFLRRHLPYEHGVPGERWLTILMNRINPALFANAFAGWVRESWPEKASLVAIDGKTSRRSHDRSAGAGPLHLVSAFATTARLVLAQEAVPDKANELAAIPPLLERLGAEDGLKGALVSIDGEARARHRFERCAERHQRRHRPGDHRSGRRLPARGQGQSAHAARRGWAEVEAAFAAAPGTLDSHACLDKGHGRTEERRTTVLRDTDWLDGARRFPGELRLPGAACLVRTETRVERRGASSTETRYFVSSRALPHVRERDGEAAAVDNDEVARHMLAIRLRHRHVGKAVHRNRDRARARRQERRAERRVAGGVRRAPAVGAEPRWRDADDVERQALPPPGKEPLDGTVERVEVCVDGLGRSSMRDQIRAGGEGGGDVHRLRVRQSAPGQSLRAEIGAIDADGGERPKDG